MVAAPLSAAGPLSFSRDVVPALTKAGCNAGACHGSLQGRGGLRLSLLGFDPLQDYDALMKNGRGRRVSFATPEHSLLLLKATASVPHGGGKRMDVGSAPYQLLCDYLAQGAALPGAADPHVVRIEVSTQELVLKPAESASVTAQAIWSDGVERDITPFALYDARDKTIAEVSTSGEVRALQPGRTPVTVRYAGQVSAVSVTVPYPVAQAASDFSPHNYIDQLVAAEWRKVGLAPAPPSSDSEFVRRVYLDLIGTLPTADEVSAFLAATESDKRARLIDQLLERPEYVDYWSLRWGDLLRVHRRYVGVKGLGAFWNWVRLSVRENRPIDQLTRELLTSKGSLFSNGPVAYYFVDAKPEELAETTSQVFLGVRMQCTRCHHHPMEVWSQQDYYGLAAFFTRLEIKDNGDGNGKYGGARLLKPIDTPAKDRRLAMAAEPQLFGQVMDLAGQTDIRESLASAITAPSNPFFARNFANRYWGWLIGRGIVEPVDDVRATNPPSHPALLDALADDFVKHGHDARHLIRTICNSRVYQLASNISAQRDQDGMFFSHRLPRRLSAEVLLDAVNQVVGGRENFEGVPVGVRAISLPDPSIRSYFLTTFGRPLRNSPCECARGGMPDLSQALHLVNSTELHDKIGSAEARVARLCDAKQSTAAIVEQLYLSALARRPTAEEQAAVVELLAEAPSLREGIEDLVWTLVNTSEFVFNH